MRFALTLFDLEALENAVRTQKIRNEISTARKEHDFIKEKQQQAKVFASIEKRRQQVYTFLHFFCAPSFKTDLEAESRRG